MQDKSIGAGNDKDTFDAVTEADSVGDESLGSSRQGVLRIDAMGCRCGQGYSTDEQSSRMASQVCASCVWMKGFSKVKSVQAVNDAAHRGRVTSEYSCDKVRAATADLAEKSVQVLSVFPSDLLVSRWRLASVTLGGQAVDARSKCCKPHRSCTSSSCAGPPRSRQSPSSTVRAGCGSSRRRWARAVARGGTTRPAGAGVSIRLYSEVSK